MKENKLLKREGKEMETIILLRICGKYNCSSTFYPRLYWKLSAREVIRVVEASGWIMCSFFLFLFYVTTNWRWFLGWVSRYILESKRELRADIYYVTWLVAFKELIEVLLAVSSIMFFYSILARLHRCLAIVCELTYPFGQLRYSGKFFFTNRVVSFLLLCCLL